MNDWATIKRFDSIKIRDYNFLAVSVVKAPNDTLYINTSVLQCNYKKWRPTVRICKKSLSEIVRDPMFSNIINMLDIKQFADYQDLLIAASKLLLLDPQ